MKLKLVELLDAFGHWIGWVPARLCDYYDFLLTGERIP